MYNIPESFHISPDNFLFFSPLLIFPPSVFHFSVNDIHVYIVFTFCSIKKQINLVLFIILTKCNNNDLSLILTFCFLKYLFSHDIYYYFYEDVTEIVINKECHILSVFNSQSLEN